MATFLQQIKDEQDLNILIAREELPEMAIKLNQLENAFDQNPSKSNAKKLASYRAEYNTCKNLANQQTEDETKQLNKQLLTNLNRIKSNMQIASIF